MCCVICKGQMTPVTNRLTYIIITLWTRLDSTIDQVLIQI